jgi:hypothetical protein
LTQEYNIEILSEFPAPLLTDFRLANPHAYTSKFLKINPFIISVYLLYIYYIYMYIHIHAHICIQYVCTHTHTYIYTYYKYMCIFWLCFSGELEKSDWYAHLFSFICLITFNNNNSNVFITI